ncbi:hypothetical protein FQR65_LT15786 [Abscondita terminalis]|nr:hypothetical protein FQR65_LT15786 [Abscondita terminalis]
MPYDIMDKAPLRRRTDRPYIAKWDDSVANFLSGDVLISTAYEQVAKCPKGSVGSAYNFNKFIVKILGKWILLNSETVENIFNAEIGECYHLLSMEHCRKSKHVFIQMGLDFYVKHTGLQKVSVLEIGFGTGLNFLQTAEYISASDIHVDYVGIEGYPLPLEVIKDTGYDAYGDPLIWHSFTDNYDKSFGGSLPVTEKMNLQLPIPYVMDFTS